MYNSKFKEDNFWRKYTQIYDILNTLIPYRNMLEEVVEELDIKKNDKILDIGCGTGNLSKKLTDSGCELTAIDNNIYALEVARKKNSAKTYLNINIQDKFPFDDNYFDKIVIINVLYIINTLSLGKLIGEVYRVLKKGGRIVIINPKKNFNNLYFLYRTFMLHLKIEKYKIINKLIINFPIYLKLLLYNINIRKKYNFHNMINAEELSTILLKNDFNLIKIKHTYNNQSVLISAMK